MKLIGNILIWVSLAIGLVSAPSLYAWPVGPDATFDAHFAIGTDEDGSPRYAVLKQKTEHPKTKVLIAPAEASLTPEVLATMRDAGIERATVRHPSGATGRLIANWTGKWQFLIAAAGLIGGGLLIKAAMKRDLAAPPEDGVVKVSPAELVGSMRTTIKDLRSSIATLETDRERVARIVSVLGEVQGEQVPAFAETRPQLIGTYGLGGFARIMDSFASMERKMNRAWSAAADGHYEESRDSLDEAAVFADQLADHFRA